SVDQRPHRIDGKGGALGIRWVLAEVDRRELVEAHRMVRDDDLGWHLGELSAHLVELGWDLGLCLRVGFGFGLGHCAGRDPAGSGRRLRIDRVFALGCPKAAHLRYPYGTTELGK